MVEQFPFPMQRPRKIDDVQHKIQAYKTPASPHLNGKVERSQKTDLEEFYATADLLDFETLKDELKAWQFFYNWQRPHGSLGGKTPSQYSSELGAKTPFWDEVIAAYDVKKEHIQEQNYQAEMAIRKLKLCL